MATSTYFASDFTSGIFRGISMETLFENNTCPKLVYEFPHGLSGAVEQVKE